MQIAVVATARKLAVLCWHMITRGEDYAFARPSLTAKKLRALELQAGMPPRRGQKGRAAGYSLKDVRAREKQMAEQAERAYRQLVGKAAGGGGEAASFELVDDGPEPLSSLALVLGLVKRLPVGAAHPLAV